jgi:hypothetical protein
MFGRWIEPEWAKKFAAPYVHIVCRCQTPLRLHDKITALPWFCL